MPQNTPMKRQFTTIDGRTVMSNLPQHWGGNDWTITGVDNPLPVGNYVQTEAGVWIPQKGSDDGAADVRLTGSNVEDVTLIERTIISENQQVVLDIPEGAIGVFVHTRIRSLVGDFSSNEGVGTIVNLGKIYPSGGHFYLVDLSTDSKSSNAHLHTIWLGRQTTTQDTIINPARDEYKEASVHVGAFDLFRFRVILTGENVEVDIESVAKWIF